MVKLLDAFTNPEADDDPTKLSKVYLVMEYFEYDMHSLLSQKKSSLSTGQAKTLIYNLLMAVNYLHSTGIMH